MGWNEWVRGAEVEPSLCCADFARLGEQVEELLGAGVRIFHFDVADGHFVEPLTTGQVVLQSVSERIHAAGAFLDVHLMVERPAESFDSFAAAGADSVTFHAEAVDDVPATIALARGHGLEIGVAFDPGKEPAVVAAVAGAADVVLCTPADPGRPFQESTFARVRELRGLLPPETLVQVEGGVGDGNVRRLRREGASLFAAGTSIFGDPDPVAAYRRLAQEAQ
jgi:ribulose-phosphate 3-epimerase